MANIKVKDADANVKYLKATGAGTDGDPYITQNLDSNSASSLTALQAIQAAVELLDNIISGNEAQVDVVTSTLPAGAATETTLSAVKTAVELLSSAISDTEMQVDIVSSALPTGASTSANQTTIIGHVDGIESLLTSIDTDTSSLAGTVNGTELQVDVLTVPSGLATKADQEYQSSLLDGLEGLLTDLNTVASGIKTDTSLLTTIDADTGNIVYYNSEISTTTSGILTAVELIDNPVATISSTDVMRVAIFDDSDSQITTFGGGTQYTEGDVDSSITGNVMLAEAGSDTVEPLQLDTSNYLKVNISADDVGIGGGVQYTEGDTDATIDGTAIMWEDTGDTLRAVSDTYPLPVDISVSTLPVTQSGLWDINDISAGTQTNDVKVTLDGEAVTETNSSAILSDTSSMDTNLGTVAGAVSGGQMQVDVVGALPTGDNNIGNVDIASSVALDVSAAVVSIDDNSDSITIDNAELVTLAGAVSGGEMQVELTTDSVGLSTSANQSTMITALQLIDDPVATISATDVMRVAIFDDSDSQITTFGGGTQYTEGDTDATIMGTAFLWEDSGDTLRAISNSYPLPVNVGANIDLSLTELPVTQSGVWNVTEENSSAILSDTGNILTAVQIIDNPVATISATDVMRVAIFDDSDSQITTFGGGQQYTEGDTDSTITGTAIMWEDGADTLRAVSQSYPLPVAINDSVPVTQSGVWNITETNSAAILADTGNMDTNLGTLAGAVTGSEMQVDIVSDGAGLATSANQSTMITSLGLLDDTVATISSTDLLRVAMFDDSDNQITVFGGGYQYSGGYSSATLYGNVMLWEDTADTVRPVSINKPLPILITNQADPNYSINVVQSGIWVIEGFTFESEKLKVTLSDDFIDDTLTTISATPVQRVVIFDDSDTQILDFVGAEYTEGDTDASITGRAILWEDSGDTLRAVSSTYPLPIEVTDASVAVTMATLPDTSGGDLATLAGAVAGTEMQVDLVAITPDLMLGTDFSTVFGTSSVVAGSELQVDVVGALPAGTNTVGTVGLAPQTSGGLTIYRDIDADETGVNIKSSAGQVFGWYIYNTVASGMRYVKLYNKASAPTVGTDTPVITIPLNGGQGANVEFVNGIAFGTGIGIGVTTGALDTDTGAPGTNEVIANVFYK